MVAIASSRHRVLLHARSPDDRERFVRLVRTLGAEATDLASVPDAELHAATAVPVLAQTGGEDCPLDRLLDPRADADEVRGRTLILLSPAEQLGRLIARTEKRPHAILLAEPFEAEELASILRASLAIEARRQEVKSLLERLRHTNEELDRRRRAAEDEARRRVQFLAAISHDLRTPLWEIALFGQVVQAAAIEPSTHVDWNRLANGLLAGVATLRERVDDLFDLARLDLGAVEIRPSRFSLAPFLERVLDSFRQEAEARGLSFSIATDPPWAEVTADSDMLARILQNLASNALKFTESGSVEVSANVVSPGGLRFSVRDTGRGMNPESVATIFDEFAQLHNPERDRHKGTGLGLAISRRLARMMGGTIDVQSEAGRGSEFTLTLPESSGVLDSDRPADSR